MLHSYKTCTGTVEVPPLYQVPPTPIAIKAEHDLPESCQSPFQITGPTSLPDSERPKRKYIRKV